MAVGILPAGISRFFVRLLPFMFVLPASYPQRKGVIEGRLINGTDSSMVAGGVDVDAIRSESGTGIVKSSSTDAGGKFRMDDIPSDETLIVRANYKGAIYQGLVSFDSSAQAFVEIEVFEPTTSTKDIRVDGIQMAFQLMGDRIKSLEVISFDNGTKPPRTFVSADGTYRFSKPAGILEFPRITIKSPGAAMPLVQYPLESPDGSSYYTLYPLQPGTTVFEVEQILPYKSGSYVYQKRFYQDIGSANIGVVPRDMTLSGTGLTKATGESRRNFAVYRSGPIRAGSEVVWTFSGGTPADGSGSSGTAGRSSIQSVPDYVAQNALVIGPLILMGFVVVLWFACKRLQKVSPVHGDSGYRELVGRRELILSRIADLDREYELCNIGRREYLERRREDKRQLRRISLILKKR